MTARLCSIGSLGSALALSGLFVLPATLARAGEAASGFGGETNGLVNDDQHARDTEFFEEVDDIDEGLGPLYNAPSCVACHANPITGGSSQVSELRVGHSVGNGKNAHFEAPSIPLSAGVVIPGRTLVNDRAICPNGEFPDQEIQERVPESEDIRTFRMSLNLLGDGFVEAVPDSTLLAIANAQCTSNKKICGQALMVPILEAPGVAGVGRFGWKAQHASLLSFSADAYLNEMGVTTPLLPDEVTDICSPATVPSPNDQSPDIMDGLLDFEHFARFMRATQAPARDMNLALSAEATTGATLFEQIGCATCHVATLTTAQSGKLIRPGFPVPAALAGKTFHPYSDLLLHDVGTGDGIPATPPGSANAEITRSKFRTPPLWGLRMRPRLMHDGESLTLRDAIQRHTGEGGPAAKDFKKLSEANQEAVLVFLRSL